jgi:hypothetical protein
MTASFSRIIMTVATASLGAHRGDWKLAMESEFDAATEEGTELSFALGCLTTAWRELPAHLEGQMTLASYTFILGLILPAAALLIVGLLAGYPYVDASYVGAIGSFAKVEMNMPRINAGNASVVPVLGLILLLRIASDALVAWFAVERDWGRAAAALSSGAAATITLALFAGIAMLDETCVIMPAFTFAIELLAVAMLHRWHDQAGEPGET